MVFMNSNSIPILIEKGLVGLDCICDYIPFVSSLSNIVDLVAKSILDKSIPYGGTTNYYFTHLRAKSSNRSTILLIPIIGNIVVCFYDIFAHMGNFMDHMGKKESSLDNWLIWDDQQAILKYMRDNLKGDFSYPSLACVSQNLKNDKKFIIEYLSELKNSISCLSIKNTFELTKLENRESDVLKHVGLRLQGDKDVVMAALDVGYRSFRYASEELRDQNEILLKAIKDDPRALEFASNRMRDDEALILKCVKENPLAFAFASEKLRNNKEFVRKVCEVSSSSFEHAGETLQSDKSFALELMKKYRANAIFKSLTTELQKDEELVIEYVKGDGNRLECDVGRDFLSNEKVVLEAAKENPAALCYADEKFLKDEKFILKLLEERGAALKAQRETTSGYIRKSSVLNLLHSDLKGNRGIVLEAVKQNGLELEFASEALRKDEDLVLEAISEDSYAAEFIHKEIFKKAFFLKALKIDDCFMKYVNEQQRAERKFMLDAVEQNSGALNYVSQVLRYDEGFLREALVHANFEVQEDQLYYYPKDNSLWKVVFDNLALQLAKPDLISTPFEVLNRIRRVFDDEDDIAKFKEFYEHIMLKIREIKMTQYGNVRLANVNFGFD